MNSNIAKNDLFSSLHVDELPILDWFARNGAGYHVRQINKLLPGSITCVRDYIQSLPELANNTIVTYLVAVKSSCLVALGDRYLFDLHTRTACDLFFKSIMPRRDRRQRARAISLEYINRLFEESGLRTSLIMRNLFTLGRRVTDLCTLRWENIKRESDDLYSAEVLATKSRNYELFRIPAWLVEMNRIVFRGREYFVETQNHKPYTRGTVLKLIMHAGETVLKEKINAHLFRHCFATHQMRTNPGRLRAIIAQGGWTSMQEFIYTYGHDYLEPGDFMGQPSAQIIPFVPKPETGNPAIIEFCNPNNEGKYETLYGMRQSG